ncbi:hypothetical protein JCM6882_004201 [Rhodosporidiobolus microsporus]
MASATASLQTLLDQLVADGAAPGLVASAFTRDGGVFASAAAGHRNASADAPPMELDSVLWFASSSKPFVSLAVLQVVEKEGFDLDSHEALAEVVPELRKGYEGSRVWEVLEGPDAEGNWASRPAKNGITLRHLLTHTSGISAPYFSHAGVWIENNVYPKGFDPNKLMMHNYNVPKNCEAGEAWFYGLNNGWTSLFLMRKTGLSLRSAVCKLVIEPLGIPPDSMDPYITPSMRSRVVDIALRNPADGSFFEFPGGPVYMPQYEDVPPEGELANAEAPMYGTIGVFADFLRSFLFPGGPVNKEGKPLLSSEMWAQATSDDLKKRGIDIKQGPFMPGAQPMVAAHITNWANKKIADTASAEGDGEQVFGWSLTQNITDTGLRPGTLEWSGLANTYYFIDRERGIGAVISGQFFPWGDAKMLKARDVFFKWAGENAPKA